ncbi:MAG: amidohydrolase family protein, partial [Solirubrobacterales bacterium]
DGITGALLSAVPTGFDSLPAAEAVDLARACNDELASLPERSSGRLAALAVLPLAAPNAAADELRRAADLGLPGAQLFSNIEGAALDEERFRPVFAAAAELDVPLVLHPTRPVEHASLDDYGLLTTLGFLYETTTCAVRLVFGGLYERHPDVKVVIPHAGSVLPYILPRIDYETRLFGSWQALSSPPSEQIRRFYVDSVCLWPPALRLALEVFGDERVMFGTDEPFWSGADGVATVEELDPDEFDPERIYWKNAQRIFGALAESKPTEPREPTRR